MSNNLYIKYWCTFGSEVFRPTLHFGLLVFRFTNQSMVSQSILRPSTYFYFLFLYFSFRYVERLDSSVITCVSEEQKYNRGRYSTTWINSWSSANKFLKLGASISFFFAMLSKNLVHLFFFLHYLADLNWPKEQYT